MPERSTAQPRTWTIRRPFGEPQTVSGPAIQAGGHVEVVELSRCQTLEAALEVAADDLGKAANQFASMHESQQHGHYPDIQSNHHIFAKKEAKARAALASAGAGGEKADG